MSRGQRHHHDRAVGLHVRSGLREQGTRVYRHGYQTPVNAGALADASCAGRTNEQYLRETAFRDAISGPFTRLPFIKHRNTPRRAACAGELDPEDDPEADERASFLARWAGRKVPP